MKQEELQRTARRELSALNIVGIPDVSAVRKARQKLEDQKAADSHKEHPPSEARPTVVDSTTVKITTEGTEGDVSAARIEVRSNYHKFDNDVSDVLARKQTPTEQLIYHRLYRLSYGYNRNTCRVGMGALASACNIASSSKTVKKAIEGLIHKGHIAVMEGHKNNKKGTIYRVFLPCEIPGVESHTVVENTTVDSTTVKNTTVDSTTVKNTTDDVKPLAEQDSDTVVESTTVDSTTVKNTTVESTVVFSPATVVDPTTVKNTTDPVDPLLKRDDATVVNSTVVNSTTNKYKKKQFKNTLSPGICNIIYTTIRNFYEKVGQPKISRQKRERAENDFKELLNDGFSPEDVQFAIEWTLANAKEKPYDFSMIKHTIGQAMAVRKEAEAEKARRLQREKIAEKEREEEKRRKAEEEEVNAYKRGLTAEERAKLRETAEAQIRDSGQFKEEFITEHLIEAKENEILAKRLAPGPTGKSNRKKKAK